MRFINHIQGFQIFLKIIKKFSSNSFARLWKPVAWSPTENIYLCSKTPVLLLFLLRMRKGDKWAFLLSIRKVDMWAFSTKVQRSWIESWTVINKGYQSSRIPLHIKYVIKNPATFDTQLEHFFEMCLHLNANCSNAAISAGRILFVLDVWVYHNSSSLYLWPLQ